MHKFKIAPHVGIGPILLGASRDSVRAALSASGYPLESSEDSLDYFASSGIQIEYGPDGCADFIGIACGKTYRLTYYDVDVFNTPADEIFDLIARRDNSGDWPFDASGFVFPNQIVTLWEADEQYDRLGGEQRPIWAQVGLGNERYLEAVNEI